MGPEKGSAVRALDRGLTIIETLASREAMSLADIHKRTSLAKPSLLRALKTLTERGWVRRRIDDGRYQLSSKPLSVLKARKPHHPIVEIAEPHLIRLQSKIIWPSDIAIVTGLGVIEILESTRSIGPLTINAEVVGLRPSMIFSAIGRAFLANCDEPTRTSHIEAILNSGSPEEKANINSGAFTTILEQTREDGYAVREPSYWGQFLDDAADISVIAIPFATDKVDGCLNVTWVADLMTIDAAAERYLTNLKQCARNIAIGLNSLDGMP